VPEAYFIYLLFFRDAGGGGYLKVGLSGSVSARLASLRSSCPLDAEGYITVEVGPSRRKARAVERALHDALGAYRVRKNSEFFRVGYPAGDWGEVVGPLVGKVLSRHLPLGTRVSISSIKKAGLSPGLLPGLVDFL
jgi:hypothetical protein